MSSITPVIGKCKHFLQIFFKAHIADVLDTGADAVKRVSSVALILLDRQVDRPTLDGSLDDRFHIQVSFSDLSELDALLLEYGSAPPDSLSGSAAILSCR